MSNVTKRLEELLNLKDEQLEQKDEEICRQSETIRQLEYQLEFGVDWMRHRYTKLKDETLPVPRIELMLVVNQDYCQEYRLSLVLSNVGSDVSYVPLGYSKRSGTTLEDLASLPNQENIDVRLLHQMPSLITDGSRQMSALKIPMYVVLSEKHIYQVIDGRPLMLQAVK